MEQNVPLVQHSGDLQLISACNATAQHPWHCCQKEPNTGHSQAWQRPASGGFLAQGTPSNCSTATVLSLPCLALPLPLSHCSTVLLKFTEQAHCKKGGEQFLCAPSSLSLSQLQSKLPCQCTNTCKASCHARPISRVTAANLQPHQLVN